MGAGEHFSQIGSRKLPFERLGDRFIIDLEVQEALGHGRQRWKIVWREDISLHDGEVDLDLIEPTGMHRQMHQLQIGKGAL